MYTSRSRVDRIHIIKPSSAPVGRELLLGLV